MKIAIITPVRNEEAYIHSTLTCMIRQTVLPNRWIIVDDGSIDQTSEIIRQFIKKHSFIEYIILPDRGYRKPSQGVIEAFYEGYAMLNNDKYDVIAKFDGDLDFPPNTIEKILSAFISDTKLGIIGGTRYEQTRKGSGYKKVLVPKGFVGGPYKFYRKTCFDEIGPLIPQAGWDGVDIVRAQMKGWKTGELEDLKILHLKSTGTAEGEGLKKACEKYGYVSYYMGGYFWYFILRVILRSISARDPMVGYYMIQGFVNSRRQKKPRELKDFRKQVRRMQLKNMVGWFTLIFKIRLGKSNGFFT